MRPARRERLRPTHRPGPAARAILPPALLLVLLCASTLQPGAAAARPFGTPDFPCPPELRPRVQFWIDVFTRYSRHDRVLHDARYPWIVYEVLPVVGLSQAQIDRAVERRKDYYSRILESASLKPAHERTREEQRVAELFAEVEEGAPLTRARERIHSQQGVREEFELGLRRSGRYEHMVAAVLDSMGVPPELAWLPLVESAYNPRARSKAGAAGLWQFTQSTGKRFMRVAHDLDERLDPTVATAAAARYLSDAHNVLGNWPLAITSYNHGVAGVLRACGALDTRDLAVLIREYDGPRWGYASRNFYCEFLAAVAIAMRPEAYIGPFEPDPPEVHDSIRLRHWVRAPVLARALSVPVQALAEVNPALGSSYLQGSRWIPAGYRLHVPRGRVLDLEGAYAGIPSEELRSDEPAPRGYTVRRGDTLGAIARRHRVSVDALRRMNRIEGDLIRPGQVLVVPDPAQPRL